MRFIAKAWDAGLLKYLLYFLVDIRDYPKWGADQYMQISCFLTAESPKYLFWDSEMSTFDAPRFEGRLVNIIRNLPSMSRRNRDISLL